MLKLRPKTIYNRNKYNCRYKVKCHNKSTRLFISFGIILINLLLGISVQASNTDKVYVSRSEQGVLVYSGNPSVGTKEVAIKKSNISTAPVKMSFLKTPQNVVSEKYHVEILKPVDNTTVRDHTGTLHVFVGIRPLLKTGLSMQLYLDNEPYGQPQVHSTFKLNNLDRGEHQVLIHLLNVKGKVIALSGVITVYMHRASLKIAN